MHFFSAAVFEIVYTRLTFSRRLGKGQKVAHRLLHTSYRVSLLWLKQIWLATSRKAIHSKHRLTSIWASSFVYGHHILQAIWCLFFSVFVNMAWKNRWRCWTRQWAIEPNVIRMLTFGLSEWSIMATPGRLSAELQLWQEFSVLAIIAL